jgi:hypothetical protein
MSTQKYVIIHLKTIQSLYYTKFSWIFDSMVWAIYAQGSGD